MSDSMEFALRAASHLSIARCYCLHHVAMRAALSIARFDYPKARAGALMCHFHEVTAAGCRS